MRAPYKGNFSEGILLDGGGCAKDRVFVVPAFNFSNGTGGLGLTGTKAKVCAGSSFAGFGSSSYADLQANGAIEIKFHVPSGFHSVAPRLDFRWSFNASYSNGSGCPSPKPFAHSYNNTVNASYASWYNVSGADSFCESYALIAAWVNQISLVDLTNGTYIPIYSGCQYCQLFQNETQAFFSSGWEFYNDTTYSNGQWSYSSGVYSLNSSSATAPSLNGAAALRIPADYRYGFVSGHVYALAIFASTSIDVVAEGFVGGYATATLNFATSGNGVSIPRIVIR